MAYNPDSGRIYQSAHGIIPSGHYGLRANDFDGRTVVTEASEDPIELAQREAFEAAATLDTTPRRERTPQAIAEVDKLSRRASSLATEANVALVLKR
jgi:hypothetical protein